MTDAELQGISAQALNMAKRDLDRGNFNFLLAVYHQADEQKLHRMVKVEELIIKKMGEEWLNDGLRKDIGFRIIREAVDWMPPEAVVFVTACNMFTPTEKLSKLPVEERRKLLDGGHDRHHEAVQTGLLAIGEGLLAIAQTPERVCMYQQKVEKLTFTGHPETKFFPQADFGGRMKMFGKEEL